MRTLWSVIEDEEPKRLEMSAHGFPCPSLPPFLSCYLHDSSLPQTLAPGLSSVQSRGGGKELRLFSFHRDFQSISAAHAHILFSFNCLIPRTLLARELSKVPPGPSCTTWLWPFLSLSKVGSSTMFTAALGGEILYRPSFVGNVSFVPWDPLSVSTVGWGGSTAVEKMGKT